MSDDGPTPWRDMLTLAWEFRMMFVAALMALAFFTVFLGSAYVARYQECRAHGFSTFYCSVQR